MTKNLKDIYSGVNKSDADRRVNDFYPTPPLAVWCLNKYGNVPKHVLEPCAGRGNISIELKRNDKIVYSRDLYEYENSLVEIETGLNVLAQAKHEHANALITNPPYHKNLPLKIAQHGIDNYDYTAILVRLTFLEGKSRKKLFTKYPPSQILIFSDRMKFSEYSEGEPIEKEDQIGGMICYCWVIWDKKTSSDTAIKWILLEEEYDAWRENYEERNVNVSSRVTFTP